MLSSLPPPFTQIGPDLCKILIFIVFPASKHNVVGFGWARNILKDLELLRDEIDFVVQDGGEWKECKATKAFFEKFSHLLPIHHQLHFVLFFKSLLS